MSAIEPVFMVAIGIIIFVLILNVYFTFRRANGKIKRKGGRKYSPPTEVKQAEWRAKEIARRLEREQDDALEHITLRNETLSYFELVRQKYAKKEALERLGIRVDDEKLGEIDSLQSEELKYRDVRDDVYVIEQTDEQQENSGDAKE